MFTEMFFMNDLQLLMNGASKKAVGEAQESFMKQFLRSAKNNIQETAKSGFLEEGVIEEGLSWFGDALWRYGFRGETPNPREFFEAVILSGVSMAPVAVKNTMDEVSGIYKMSTSPRHYLPSVESMHRRSALQAELKSIDEGLEKEDISEKERTVLEDAKAVVLQQIEEQKDADFALYMVMSPEDQNQMATIHADMNELLLQYEEAKTKAGKKKIGEELQSLVNKKQELEQKYDNQKKQVLPAAQQIRQAIEQAQSVPQPSEEEIAADRAVQAQERLNKAQENLIIEALGEDETLNAMDAGQEIDQSAVDLAQGKILDLIDNISKSDMAEESKAAYIQALEDKFDELEYYDNKTITTTEQVTERVPVGAPQRIATEQTGETVKPGRLKLQERLENVEVALGTEQKGQTSVLEVQKDGSVDVVTYNAKTKEEVSRQQGVAKSIADLEYVDSIFDDSGNLTGVTMRPKTEAGTEESPVRIEIKNRPDLALDLAIAAKKQQLGPIPQTRFEQAYEEVTKTTTTKTKAPVKQRPSTSEKTDAKLAEQEQAKQQYPVEQGRTEPIETPVESIDPASVKELGEVVVMKIGNVLNIPGVNKEALAVINRYLNVLYSVRPDVTLFIHPTQESIAESHQSASNDTEGYYVDGQIHIFIDNLTKGLIDNDARVLRHEIIHPILDALIKESPRFVDSFGAEILKLVSLSQYDDVAAIQKLRIMAKDIAKAIEEGNVDAVIDAKVELITEFFAQFSDEKNLKKLAKNPTLFDRIKQLLNKLFGFLGVNYRVQTYADVFDTLQKLKASFDQGKAFTVPSKTQKGNAASKIAQSVRVAPFSSLEEFGIPATMGAAVADLIPLDTLKATIVEKGAVKDSEMSISFLDEFLDRLALATGVPFVYVNSGDFGAKFIPLNVTDRLRVAGIGGYGPLRPDEISTGELVELASENGYDVGESPYGFVAVNINAQEQALYSYASVFFNKIRATDPFKFNSIMESVVKENYSGKDQVIIEARDLFKTLILQHPQFLQSNLSGKEVAELIENKGIESLDENNKFISEIAYISIASAISNVMSNQYNEELDGVLADVMGEVEAHVAEEISEYTPTELSEISPTTDLHSIARYISSKDFRTELFSVDQTNLFKNWDLENVLTSLMASDPRLVQNFLSLKGSVQNAMEGGASSSEDLLLAIYEKISTNYPDNVQGFDDFIEKFYSKALDPYSSGVIHVMPIKHILDPNNSFFEYGQSNIDYLKAIFPELGLATDPSKYDDIARQTYNEAIDYVANVYAALHNVSLNTSKELRTSGLKRVTNNRHAVASTFLETLASLFSPEVRASFGQRTELSFYDVLASMDNEYLDGKISKEDIIKASIDGLKSFLEQVRVDFNGMFPEVDGVRSFDNLPLESKARIIKQFHTGRIDINSIRADLVLLTKKLAESRFISDEQAAEFWTKYASSNSELSDFVDSTFRGDFSINDIQKAFNQINGMFADILNVLSIDNVNPDLSYGVYAFLDTSFEPLMLLNKSIYTNSSSLIGGIIKSGYDGAFGWGNDYYNDFERASLSPFESTFDSAKIVLISISEAERRGESIPLSASDNLFLDLARNKKSKLYKRISEASTTIMLDKNIITSLNGIRNFKEEREDWGVTLLEWINAFTEDDFSTGDAKIILEQAKNAKSIAELIAIANSAEAKKSAPALSGELADKLGRSRNITIPVKFSHPDKWYVDPNVRGKEIDGNYKLSLSMSSGRQGLFVDVSYNTDVYGYSNVPGYLMPGLRTVFLTLSETITKTFPDVPLAGIKFSAIEESNYSHPHNIFFNDEINDAAADTSHPHHDEAVKIQATFGKKQEGNFRRLALNSAGFQRAVSGSFATQQKPWFAVIEYQTDNNGQDFAQVLLVNAKKGARPGVAWNPNIMYPNVLQTIKDVGGVEGEDYQVLLSPEEIKDILNTKPFFNLQSFVESWNNTYALMQGPAFGRGQNGTFSIPGRSGSTYYIPKIYANTVLPSQVEVAPIPQGEKIRFSNRVNQSIEDAAKQGLEDQERMQQEYLEEIKNRESDGFLYDLMSQEKGLIWDRQAGVKENLREIEKRTGVKGLEDLLVVRAGAQGEADYMFRKIEKGIWGGLKKGELDILDRIIFTRRIIQIENNRSQKVLNAKDQIEVSKSHLENLKAALRTAPQQQRSSIERQIIGIKEQIKINEQIIKDNQPNVNAQGQSLHPNNMTWERAMEELYGQEALLGKDKFNELNSRANAYFDAFAQDLLRNFEAGRINEETYERFKNQDYQPRLYLQKMFGLEDAAFFQSKGMKQEYIKGIKNGSNLSIFTDSRALLAMQMQATSRAIYENNANLALAKQISPETAHWLREANVSRDANGEVITDNYGNQKVEPADGGFVNVFYREKGALKAFQMSKQDYAQWQDMNRSYYGLGNGFKWMLRVGSGSNILKLQATGINPLFGLFQMPADFIRVVLTRGSVYNSGILPVDLLKAGFDLAKGLRQANKPNGELYEDWVKHGGLMQFLFQYGTNSKVRIMEKHRGGLFAAVGSAKRGAVNFLSYINNSTEIGMRLAIYQRTIETLKAKHPDLDIETIKFMAASESRKFADFHQGGSLSKDIDNIFPYFNAGVVTTKSTWDGIKANPMRFASYIGQAFIGLSGLMAYNLLSYGDDWDKVPDWEKSRYHIIFLPFLDEEGNRRYVRIKKDYALMPFFTMGEMIAENVISYNTTGKFKKYEEGELKRIFELNSTAIPFFIPGLDNVKSLGNRTPLASAAIKYFAGYDSFRNRVIHPDVNQENLPPHLEGLYDEKVEYFYKALGDKFGKSPVRMKAATESFILGPASSEVTNLAYMLADYIALSTYDLPEGVPTVSSDKRAETVLKNLNRNTVMRAVRSTNPDWKNMINQESGEIGRIKEFEAEEDFHIRKRLGIKAKERAETFKEGQQIPGGLPEDIREYINKLPLEKRGYAANLYIYQLRSAHYKVDPEFMPILFARTPTEAAKMFYSIVGTNDVSSPEAKDVLKTLAMAGFRPSEKFATALKQIKQ